MNDMMNDMTGPPRLSEARGWPGSVLGRVAWGALYVLLIAGCTAGTAETTCEELTGVIRACYPELSNAAMCTPEILERYSMQDLATMSCEEIDTSGKADVFSHGGCGDNEHTCGWLFCCYHGLTWAPTTESEWDIVGIVQAYQREIPVDISAQLSSASREELRDAFSVTFEQDVDDGLHGGPHPLAVEITEGIVEVSLEDFLIAVPAADWGVQLDHYLGGEVDVHETDSEGRVVRQVERMVLSPLPIDVHTPFNLDMTKVERIVYEEDVVTVYWRVMFSDNGSTEIDVGSVTFARNGPGETMVTWHSAHRLRAPGSLLIPNSLARLSLASFFSDQIRHYRELAE